jgi:hypothetical protein
MKLQEDILQTCLQFYSLASIPEYSYSTMKHHNIIAFPISKKIWDQFVYKCQVTEHNEFNFKCNYNPTWAPLVSPKYDPWNNKKFRQEYKILCNQTRPLTPEGDLPIRVLNLFPRADSFIEDTFCHKIRAVYCRRSVQINNCGHSIYITLKGWEIMK